MKVKVRCGKFKYWERYIYCIYIYILRLAWDQLRSMQLQSPRLGIEPASEFNNPPYWYFNFYLLNFTVWGKGGVDGWVSAEPPCPPCPHPRNVRIILNKPVTVWA